MDLSIEEIRKAFYDPISTNESIALFDLILTIDESEIRN